MFSFLKKTGPFKHKNARLYLLFTIFYNARAYYPVLTILFLDLGLTLSQFIALNIVWAATIFLLEVPSGAFADTWGRKKLLTLSSVLMLAEMLLLLFAPKDGGFILLSICAANRLLSGTSEALASGADEALVYDTLEQAGDENLWDELLSFSMKLRSFGFVIAMALGGLLYDPSILNKLTGLNLDQSLTLRLPLILVTLQSIGCIVISLYMNEVDPKDPQEKSIKAALKTTLGAVRWVLQTKVAFTIILGSLIIDAFSRNFATITSQYYRVIAYPEWSFGFIGAFVGIVGIFIPGIARKQTQRFSLLTNYFISGIILFLGLIGLAFAIDYWGIIPGIIVMAALAQISFFTSYYLNRITSSKQRATVLSVKGLAFNLGYGGISLVYSALVASLKTKYEHSESQVSDNSALVESLWYLPLFLAIAMSLYFVWAKFFGENIPATKKSP